MRKLLLLLVPAMLVLASCDLFNSHGKKVTIEKSGVFYKDGATEAEAKALGEYLLEIGYFDDKTEKSAQVLKDGNRHVVRLVVDEKKLKELENATTAFWIMQLGISQQVFDKEPIQLVLVNDKMKEVETIDAIAELKVNEKASVYYNSDLYKKADVRKLAGVFEEQGFLSAEGEQTILLSGDENNNVVRMLVDKEGLGDNMDAFMPVYQMLAYKLKEDAFDNKKTTLYLTASADFIDIKKVPMPSEEDMAQLMEQLNQLTNGNTTDATSSTDTESATEPEFVQDSTDGY